MRAALSSLALFIVLVSRSLADTGIAGQTRQALENINASARVRGELARAGGEVHGVPHGHQGLRGYERGVRDVFPEGSARALHSGRKRARVGRAGGDRVSGGGG